MLLDASNSETLFSAATLSDTDDKSLIIWRNSETAGDLGLILFIGGIITSQSSAEIGKTYQITENTAQSRSTMAC